MELSDRTAPRYQPDALPFFAPGGDSGGVAARGDPLRFSRPSEDGDPRLRKLRLRTAAIYRPTKLVKVDILVNGERVDALSQLVHEERRRVPGRSVTANASPKRFPRHNFKIAIQGAIGGKIIARTNIRAFRKDVTAKCYGGDVTRKRKLLERQKARQKAHEAGGERADPPGGLRRRPEIESGRVTERPDADVPDDRFGLSEAPESDAAGALCSRSLLFADLSVLRLRGNAARRVGIPAPRALPAGPPSPSWNSGQNSGMGRSGRTPCISGAAPRRSRTPPVSSGRWSARRSRRGLDRWRRRSYSSRRTPRIWSATRVLPASGRPRTFRGVSPRSAGARRFPPAGSSAACTPRRDVDGRGLPARRGRDPLDLDRPHFRNRRTDGGFPAGGTRGPQRSLPGNDGTSPRTS